MDYIPKFLNVGKGPYLRPPMRSNIRIRKAERGMPCSLTGRERSERASRPDLDAGFRPRCRASPEKASARRPKRASSRIGAKEGSAARRAGEKSFGAGLPLQERKTPRLPAWFRARCQKSSEKSSGCFFNFIESLKRSQAPESHHWMSDLSAAGSDARKERIWPFWSKA